MVGNIGTGKTTTTKVLMKDNLNVLTVSDDATARALNGGYYGCDIWTDKHWPLYSRIKGENIRAILEAGFDVVVDGTHMSKNSRKRFIDIAKELGAPVIVYVHSNAAKGLKRRLADPRRSDLETWRRVHAGFEKKYEKPTTDEGIITIIDSAVISQETLRNAN